MLIHINQPEVATHIQNAWLKTIEDGIHTADFASKEYTKEKVGTDRFADAVIERLGEMPKYFKPVDYQPGAYTKIECYGSRPKVKSKKELIGIDVFIDNPNDTPADELAKQLSDVSDSLKLQIITSRGLKIWPNSTIESPYLRHCCCRFQTSDDLDNLTPTTHADIIDLLNQMNNKNLDVIKTENLYTFDGELGFTLAQGQ